MAESIDEIPLEVEEDYLATQKRIKELRLRIKAANLEIAEEIDGFYTRHKSVLECNNQADSAASNSNVSD